MANKIDRKIIGYKVVTEQGAIAAIDEVPLEIMNENIQRPDFLVGSTYKVKSPAIDQALYVTINDIILNEGTEFEQLHPYEVFINSKNMENFQWILAITRLISAIWRKGGDATFFIEELKNVFDPKGGYFKRGGVYIPSLVAEIGLVIENHLQRTGFLVVEEDSYMKKYLEEKKTALTATESSEFPDSCTLCTKCNVKAVTILDGCATCLNCGDSKCG